MKRILFFALSLFIVGIFCGTGFGITEYYDDKTATTDTAGVSERSTDAEAITGTDTERHVTPANLAAREAGTDVDRGEYYDTGLQNIPDLASNGPAYFFEDASNDNIATGQDLVTGYGGFSIVALAKSAELLDVAPVNAYLASHGMAYGGLYAEDPTASKMRFKCYDGVLKSVYVSFDTATDQDWHAWAGTIDTTGNGGDGLLRLYKDGKVEVGAHVAIASLSANGNTFNVGGDGAGRSWSGEIARVLVFNIGLTVDEVKALSSGAPVSYKYLGASQTELMPNQVDRDFSGASAWANVDLNAYGETDDLTITADTAAQYCTCPVASAPTTIGKRYRMTFDVANLVSTWTIKSFDGIQTIGTVSANGVGTAIEWTATTTGGYRIVAVATDSSADFDNFTLTQIGCVLQLEQDGIGHGQWLDNSGNELHGTVSGALPTNLPADDVERFRHTVAMTDDTTWTSVVPAGYLLESITFVESAGNAATLDLGTTSGAEDVFEQQVIAASSITTVVIQKVFSMSAVQSLYLNDDGAGAWNSGSLTATLNMKRVL